MQLQRIRLINYDLKAGDALLRDDTMKKNWIWVGVLAIVCCSAHAEPFFFSTGNPDGRLGAGSRPQEVVLGEIKIETADDFVLPLQTTINGATFTGLLPSAAPVGNILEVVIDIYRMFPVDSTNPPSGTVPTRVNSPADVDFVSRDSASASLTFTFSLSNPNFSVANSVLNGINPIPNQTTGGEGPVSGEEGVFSAAFPTPILLPAGHYFFVPHVALSSGNFYWLSAPRPIISPGTPFAGDLQAWIRNANLAPNWLRIGTDIVGGATPPTYNQVFSISGEDDRIFGDGFGG